MFNEFLSYIIFDWNISSPYLYPARMFINVDFPAPEGPIIAVNFPEVNFPEIPLSIVLLPEMIIIHT